MTRVVIVGEIYNADLHPGGGPMPGGGYPDQGLPGQQPGHIWGQRPPHASTGPIYGGGHPSGQPVPPGGPTDPGWGGGWGGGNYPSGGPVYPGGPTDPGYGQGHPGGGHPGNWVPGSGNYPTGGPIVPPQGGTDVPEDVYTPAPVPEEIASQYVVTVYDPKTMTYTTKSYPPR